MVLIMTEFRREQDQAVLSLTIMCLKDDPGKTGKISTPSLVVLVEVFPREIVLLSSIIGLNLEWQSVNVYLNIRD